MHKDIEFRKEAFYNERKILSQIGEPKDERKSKSIFEKGSKYGSGLDLKNLETVSSTSRLTQRGRKRREETWIRQRYRKE